MSSVALATFTSALRYEDLPQEVIEQAKNALQDFLGISLYVSRHTPWGASIARFAAEESGGRGDATVIGWNSRTTPARAALANGTMALGFEYEDLHMGSLSHPHSAIIPAALALAEKNQLSGREFITAIVAGYEVMARVGLACRKSLGAGMMRRGLYPTQLFGVFGAAAAAARALQLDAEKTCMALGLAGEQAAGTTQSHAEGAWSRRWHGGKAAENGITAAQLAQAGFIGPMQMLEGPYGFYRAFALEFEAEQLTAGLGEQWEIMQLWFKSHACCGNWHAALDAVLDLRQQHAIDADRVEKIEAHLMNVVGDLQTRTVFPTISVAQYSAPFCLATAMLKGRVGPAEFTEQSIRDALLIRYAIDKVDIVFDDDLKTQGLATASMPARVRIKMKDGQEYRQDVAYPRGHQSNPVSAVHMKAKFDELTTTLLDATQRAALHSAIRNIDQVANIATLAPLLGPAALP